MSAVTGRFAEVRVYLAHAYGLLRPGRELPSFGDPSDFEGDLTNHDDEDLDLLIVEGRRQLDRQANDLSDIRNRGGKLLTLGLAEVALLAATGHTSWSGSWWLTAAWILSAAFAFLASAGAASLIAGRADLGRTDSRLAACQRSPIKRQLALGYLTVVAIGEETVRTRLTVLRAAVMLAVLAALVYVPVFAAS